MDNNVAKPKSIRTASINQKHNNEKSWRVWSVAHNTYTMCNAHVERVFKIYWQIESENLCPQKRTGLNADDSAVVCGTRKVILLAVNSCIFHGMCTTPCTHYTFFTFDFLFIQFMVCLECMQRSWRNLQRTCTRCTWTIPHCEMKLFSCTRNRPGQKM